MFILGIETSCDETAVAVVGADKTIHAHVIYSQIAQHQPYGGVVPEIAARNHALHLDGLITECMQQAGMRLRDMDAIAVTHGPGLIGGVIVGVMTAKALACALDTPLYGINHLEGHALTVRLTHDVAFPYLLFLMSGGHCQLLHVAGVGRYTLLGQTLDDAIGEAFDKTAKMMGLPYPGGPQIEVLARSGNAARFVLPKPYMDKDGCDMSFSGLKTAVRTLLLELDGQQGGITPQDKADMAASLQATLATIVAHKLHKAAEICHMRAMPFTAMVVAGGVAANVALRTALTIVAEAHHVPFIAPPIGLCTDNAAMIAWAGAEHIAAGLPASPLTLEPYARLPLYHDAAM
jgi:N6-L-threonylcarbamoyladenine synthase